MYPQTFPHQAGWKHFLTLCNTFHDQPMLADLFDLLLTDEEKQVIAARTLIVQSLLTGTQTQREIASSLQVSISKITRGSNMLKRLSVNFLARLKQVLCCL